jgi:hypothetical protein
MLVPKRTASEQLATVRRGSLWQSVVVVLPLERQGQAVADRHDNRGRPYLDIDTVHLSGEKRLDLIVGMLRAPGLALRGVGPAVRQTVRSGCEQHRMLPIVIGSKNVGDQHAPVIRRNDSIPVDLHSVLNHG